MARATGMAISTVRKGRDRREAKRRCERQAQGRRSASLRGGSSIPRSGRSWRSSSSLSRVAIRNPRCDRRVRARRCSPLSCSRSTASASATRPWARCSAVTTTDSRRPPNPSRESSTQIATRRRTVLSGPVIVTSRRVPWIAATGLLDRRGSASFAALAHLSGGTLGIYDMMSGLSTLYTLQFEAFI